MQKKNLGESICIQYCFSESLVSEIRIVYHMWNAQFADKWVSKCIEQKLKISFNKNTLHLLQNHLKRYAIVFLKIIFNWKNIFLFYLTSSFIHYANIDVVVTTCRLSLEGGRVYREKT